MWEWRAFDEPPWIPEPPPALLAGIEESRVDVYVLVAGRDDLGLKVRGATGPAPKAELKVRYAREPDGSEHWEKVFARRLPLAREWASLLLAQLGAERTTEGGVSCAEDLAALVRLAELGGARLLAVEKRIRKTLLPRAFTLEHARVVREGRPLETLCAEAPTLAILRAELARRAIAAPRSAVVAGYPQAIRTLQAAAVSPSPAGTDRSAPASRSDLARRLAP